MISCTEISFVIYFFQFCEIWSPTRVSFYATQSSYLLKTLKKSNFDMFYKNDCWAVICYPIYMTNVSYERGIIVLSFSDISFVIFLFVFQRLEINFFFFFFFLLTLYIYFCHKKSEPVVISLRYQFRTFPAKSRGPALLSPNMPWNQWCNINTGRIFLHSAKIITRWHGGDTYVVTSRLSYASSSCMRAICTTGST